MEQYAQVNRMFWEGSIFQYFFYASILLILIFEKRKTHKLIFGVFPIVMLVAMFNPLTSYAVGLFFHKAEVYYVRIFSIIPVFYCMAHGLTALLDKAKGAIKLLGVCAAVALIVVAGHSIYQESWMERADNMEKIPNELTEVLSAIPSEKENPCVAFPSPLYQYARQVDGNIIMPYGRILNGAKIPLLEEIKKSVPDVDELMLQASKATADYVVVKQRKGVRTAFSDKGYAPVGETSSYLIYSVEGIPRTIRVLNEKRQVESTTTVDANGNPDYSGYTVITTNRFEYDRWGNRTKDTYFDKYGQRVTTNDGYSGIKRHYRLHGLAWVVDSLTYLDKDDNALLVSGRYETRRNYVHRRDVLEVRYFGLDGQPMNRLDTGYAASTIQYDRDGRIVSENFFDTSSNPVMCVDGYAGYTRRYDDDGRIIGENYFDTQGAPVDSVGGFARWERTYGKRGNIEERYYNAAGEAVDVKDRVMSNNDFDLLQWEQKESIGNSVGIGYSWDEDGSCTIVGQSQGISWYNLLMGEKPFYFISGETYRIQFSSEKVSLCVYFYKDSTWKDRIDLVTTRKDSEFTVPKNCGAMIIRLWIPAGASVDETVSPKIYAKG